METMNKAPVVIIGIGEMGGVFARGYLRTGHPVYPVTRTTDIDQLVQTIGEPEVVVIAVGEADLHPTLEKLPDAWKRKLLLLQNELLPDDYADFPDSTVISVWFEKKPGQDAKVIIPSPAHGPRAATLEEALGAIDIPVRVLDSAGAMEFELVVKNLYILTTNIAGLKTGGTVGELWAVHEDLARAVDRVVADDALAAPRGPAVFEREVAGAVVQPPCRERPGVELRRVEDPLDRQGRGVLLLATEAGHGQRDQ